MANDIPGISLESSLEWINRNKDEKKRKTIQVELGKVYHEWINQKYRACKIIKIGRKLFTIEYELPNYGETKSTRQIEPGMVYTPRKRPKYSY